MKKCNHDAHAFLSSKYPELCTQHCRAFQFELHPNHLNNSFGKKKTKRQARQQNQVQLSEEVGHMHWTCSKILTDLNA